MSVAMKLTLSVVVVLVGIVIANVIREAIGAGYYIASGVIVIVLFYIWNSSSPEKSSPARDSSSISKVAEGPPILNIELEEDKAIPTMQKNNSGSEMEPEDDKDAPKKLSENALYEIAWKEAELDKGDKELWAKAYSVSEGNNEKARAYYLRHRVERLKEKQKRRFEEYQTRKNNIVEERQSTEEQDGRNGQSIGHPSSEEQNKPNQRGSESKGAESELGPVAFLWVAIISAAVIWKSAQSNIEYAIGYIGLAYLVGLFLSLIIWSVSKKIRSTWKWFDWLNNGAYAMIGIFLLGYIVNVAMESKINESSLESQQYLKESNAKRNAVIQQDIEKVAQQEIERIIKGHPDVFILVKEPSFKTWFKQLHPGEQERMRGQEISGNTFLLDSGFMIQKLNEYKRFKKAIKGPTAGSSVSHSISSQPTDLTADVQSSLKKLGYYSGPIDGKYGPQTKAAIIAFEEYMGGVPTGIISEGLRRQLAAWIDVDKLLPIGQSTIKNRGCEHKPIMTDEDYIACGIQPPQ